MFCDIDERSRFFIGFSFDELVPIIQEKVINEHNNFTYEVLSSHEKERTPLDDETTREVIRDKNLLYSFDGIILPVYQYNNDYWKFSPCHNHQCLVTVEDISLNELNIKDWLESLKVIEIREE